MASSVMILFAMDTRQVPAKIIQEATERYHKRAKEQLRSFLVNKYKDLTNVILENLPSINGLPLSAFLNRMRGVIPLGLQTPTSLNRLLDGELELISSGNKQDPAAETNITHEDKIQAVRIFCRAAADPNNLEVYSKWLGLNAAILNEALANCLGTEHRDLTQETCFTIAYLARKFHFQMTTKLDLVIGALVRAMATTLIPWESYVEQYRDAKERHNDIELARGRNIAFHHPRMEYQFSEVNHRVLGCIYYTLGDLLFNCPMPKLIHFFECRIFRRREMTRNLLFTILHVVVINLNELKSEAERLATLAKQLSSENLPSLDGAGPLTSRRGKLYSETMWNDLPANLYSDIIRVYNDRNRANKMFINEIMALLRAHAPEKLPIFEEATLKALELYTGSGGGRLTETYQIGRPTTGEGSGSGSRRRKSLQAHDANAGGVNGAKAGTSTISGTLISGEASGISRQSRILAHLPAVTDNQQTEKPAEKQSSETNSTSSSEGNYSSESNKQESKISRRTIIVPKIPDLMQTTRVFRK
ncbi:hypothetical protein FBUS_00708 [Fasciolopsis buskii]|uniref:Uncharacterized protein n=1 Tax=Fasciolopsis buskii TaxID=27845 RepID=A0A8E0VED0_9TREM|nr:hypothetical protein FBUS_00708 [Fasciolopsis buski]